MLSLLSFTFPFCLSFFLSLFFLLNWVRWAGGGGCFVIGVFTPFDNNTKQTKKDLEKCKMPPHGVEPWIFGLRDRRLTTWPRRLVHSGRPGYNIILVVCGHAQSTR